MTKPASIVMGRWIFGALFCIASVCTAKADTLVCGMNCTNTGTAFVWTNIVVSGVDTSGGFTPTVSTDSVTLWYAGSGEAVAINNCTANCGTTPDSTNPDGSNAAYAALFGGSFPINSSLKTTLSSPPPTVPCADSGVQCNFYDYTLSTVCWGDSCLNPGNGTIRDLTLVSVGSGEFILQGNSLSLTFFLPEATGVAEPSSLLMAGFGLFGVIFLALRRRRAAV